MPSRQPPGDLGHVLPFVKLTRQKLVELAENDEKQAAKLSAHDASLGEICRELETVKNLLEVKVGALDETIRRIRERLNGR